MTVETDLEVLLAPTFTGRFYPDTAPLTTTKPYATYQQVGGKVVNPIGGSNPQYGEMRIQVNVWAATREQANTLMRTVESLLRPNPFAGRPIGALIARTEDTTKTRGAQMDFSIWHAY